MMLTIFPFFAILLPYYIILLITNLLGGLVGVLCGNRCIEELYIKLLLKVFAYASSTVAENEKIENRRKVLDRSMSIGNYDRDLCTINREVRLDQDGIIFNEGFIRDASNKFNLADPSYFIKSGIEAIIEDDVTKRFSSNELEVWNLLSRTHSYQHINWQLSVLWIVGLLTRYTILLPCRIVFFVTAISSMATSSYLLPFVPERHRKSATTAVSKITFRLFIRAYSGVIRFHNRENMAKGGGICVANHTTPIDVIILGCDNRYAMIGQKQGGFFGMIQKIFGRITSTIWFERSETKDRESVTRRLKDHVKEPDSLPILIFPEGTCINNTSVMMFKKGSFEVGGLVYPVAIKYDCRFADCFWNSSKYSFLEYLFMMMSSWAIVADVWYLPPERQRESEDSIEFSNRVKQYIAKQGGLIDMKWDGLLKRSVPKQSLKQVQQKSFSKLIKA